MGVTRWFTAARRLTETKRITFSERVLWPGEILYSLWFRNFVLSSRSLSGTVIFFVANCLTKYRIFSYVSLDITFIHKPVSWVNVLPVIYFAAFPAAIKWEVGYTLDRSLVQSTSHTWTVGGGWSMWRYVEISHTWCIVSHIACTPLAWENALIIYTVLIAVMYISLCNYNLEKQKGVSAWKLGDVLLLKGSATKCILAMCKNQYVYTMSQIFSLLYLAAGSPFQMGTKCNLFSFPTYSNSHSPKKRSEKHRCHWCTKTF